MTSPIGIPSTRVSDLFVRQRLTRQVQADQYGLFRVQQQISSGRRIDLPSEDAPAATRIMGLQRMIERKAQVRLNLQTSQSYLHATDTTAGTVAGSLTEARGIALSVLGTTASAEQREAAARQIDEIIRQLQDAGNQKFRGRYLFAGSETDVRPFERLPSGMIRYHGNETHLRSYSDIDLLFETNFTGSEVFGAISEPVRGSATLTPALGYDTPLADLRGGAGVRPASIRISNGSASAEIDLSAAYTVGDVVERIRSEPVVGAELHVQLTPAGLRLTLPGAVGRLIVAEVGNGTTAHELGIFHEAGVPAGTPLEGAPLRPTIRPTTPVDDLFGSLARAVVRMAGQANDLFITADTNGIDYNDVAISFFDDGISPPGGAEAFYSEVAGVKTLEIRIRSGRTTAQQVIDAINTKAEIPFSAALDPMERTGGRGIVDPDAKGLTADGAGTAFDRRGVQVVNGEQTHSIAFSTVQTVQDVLNAFNTSDAGLLATINAAGTGIDVRSRISGADFALGENGGLTAEQLGLRTLSGATSLAELHFGRGVNQNTDPGGVDFTITRPNGDVLEVNLEGLTTIQQVLDKIAALGAGGDGPLVARLAAAGNGIELTDYGHGPGTLRVTSSPRSTAAADLGLVPLRQDSATAGNPAVPAAIRIPSAGPNNDLIIRTRDGGAHGNGVAVVFNTVGPWTGPTDLPTTSFAAGALTVNVYGDTDPPTGVGTRAREIVAALAADPTFEAVLDPAETLDPADPGGGLVAPQGGPFVLADGEPAILTGTDPNPQETAGIFTALLRLTDALRANDLGGTERAIALLDQHALVMNFARAELGARQQGLDVLDYRLDIEEVDLTSALSMELDVDLAEAASTFAARQAAYEASLRTSAAIFQMTLLNYL